MDAPAAQEPVAEANLDGQNAPVASTKTRTESFSQKSEVSQTAADFIRDQMQLEADAREALPYSIESCTKPLGPIRQSVFACLTCNPPPADPAATYNAAGVCYSCSVQCHGEHILVEIFNKRNFTCDCGTTRFPSTSPCGLRTNPVTNTKGGVHSEEPDPNNEYNQNFRNRFCGCECDYDPFQQKGTMFQCLGLGIHEDGGCGEDWWHPGCIVGLGPDWFEKTAKQGGDAIKATAAGNDNADGSSALPTISEDVQAAPQDGNTAEEEENDDDDPPPPPRYAGSSGFLKPVFLKKSDDTATVTLATPVEGESSKKRKASDDDDDQGADDSQVSKRQKSESVDGVLAMSNTVELKDEVLSNSTPINSTTETSTAPPTESTTTTTTTSTPTCKFSILPPAPAGQFSLFFQESFRDKLCHCASCFPLLKPHPQLLEEEETYEPPVSDGASENGGGSTLGSGSLLERGESALRNVDRVRAIEGVMAYNHLKDKLKPFFQQFAESGQAISAEDIKEYFAKLRGDDEAIKEAGKGANGEGQGEGGQDGFRREQGGIDC
ncbi:hypothetical protein B0T17DRAFT_587247 [Bombardia bombarda]|uniref:UBR-type domain-containing protein n=1 Tax=Bombardia bombarda TaxID=252184 RepID=A0AA39XL41_9PEZI|nr:hypothetical protein B0T17DRAFT_587247 [Bombardia bombarda]